MARRSGFASTLNRWAREAERQQRAQQRAATEATREAERTGREAERALREYERSVAADQKLRARLYAEARQAETDQKNGQLAARVETLSTLLQATLGVDDFLDFATLKQRLARPEFSPGALATKEPPPVEGSFLPPPLTFFQRLLPGSAAKHEARVARAREDYAAAVQEHAAREQKRQIAHAVAQEAHVREVHRVRQEEARQHADVDAFRAAFDADDAEAVAAYFTAVLESSAYPDDFPLHALVAYVPESRQVVIESDLPPLGVVPEAGSYRYVKARDEITGSARPTTQRRGLYSSVLAQVTLRTLHEVFEADRSGKVAVVVFNGHVDTVDPGTGKQVRPCLVTVRATREAFTDLDLSRVDPLECLRRLGAAVSKSPTELAPVRPVLEFNMVDPRFVQETDVLSTLDQRPNLMALTPSEFESLITNLFEKMGLETRQTQASRDGGVDCVAYDPRPIFGGKVVIQAKRYKHTVGVSAVRDLFGTMQNEGASKGILVTTSGYGTASFDFAKGKPLELLDGTNLLYLLAEHAGIEAKIIPPEDWSDPAGEQ